MRGSFLYIVFLLSALSGPAAWGQEKPRPNSFPKVNAKDATVGIKYHEFVVLKCDDKILALYVMPDPRFGWDGFNYRWYQVTDGSDKFFLPSAAKADASPNPNVKTGTGDTNERNSGTGSFEVGPIFVEWSKGNQKSGWLYLSKLRERVQVYPQQFRRLEDFSGKLDKEKWLRIPEVKDANDH